MFRAWVIIEALIYLEDILRCALITTIRIAITGAHRTGCKINNPISLIVRDIGVFDLLWGYANCKS